MDWEKIRERTFHLAAPAGTIPPLCLTACTGLLGPPETPPNVPTLSNPEDASNFDEVEDEEPEPKEKAGKGPAKPTGFQGEELPFVGYSYTRPLLNHVLALQPSSGGAAIAFGHAEQGGSGAGDPVISHAQCGALVLALCAHSWAWASGVSSGGGAAAGRGQGAAGDGQGRRRAPQGRSRTAGSGP